ncbi:MAG: hypothetical protein AAGF55_01025 [Pseudomonadota bacterium]
MLTNDQMKPQRFAKLAKGRKLMARMAECWDRGGFVRVGTSLNYTDYKPKHRDLIEMGRSGSIYARRGKRADCLDFCSFQFSA